MHGSQETPCSSQDFYRLLTNFSCLPRHPLTITNDDFIAVTNGNASLSAGPPTTATHRDQYPETFPCGFSLGSITTNHPIPLIQSISTGLIAVFTNNDFSTPKGASMMKLKVLAILAVLFVFPAACECRANPVTYGSNLVPNGSFESSDVTDVATDGSVNGFVSEYLNIRDFYNLTAEGAYAIGENPSGSYGNPYFPNGANVGVFGGRVPASGFGDHTSGSGMMMIVNGASDTSKYVWQLADEISVSAGKTYRFEAWTSTFGLNGNPGEALAEMRFEISLDAGTQWQQLGVTRSVANTAAWQQTYVDGQFTASAEVLVRLMNNQSAVGGNDFAIDDIFFGEVTGSSPVVTFTGNPANNVNAAVPEPSTWALGLVGLACGGWLTRRRGSRTS